jgi:hypothetical protein
MRPVGMRAGEQPAFLLCLAGNCRKEVAEAAHAGDLSEISTLTRQTIGGIDEIQNVDHIRPYHHVDGTLLASRRRPGA